MATVQTSTVGKRGTIVIPAPMRRRLGIGEGSLVVIEESGGGILIRPATVMALEIYTPSRRAEFLLSNAVDEKDYSAALEEVRKMGLDPEAIPHHKPIRN